MLRLAIAMAIISLAYGQFSFLGQPFKPAAQNKPTDTTFGLGSLGQNNKIAQNLGALNQTAASIIKTTKTVAKTQVDNTIKTAYKGVETLEKLLIQEWGDFKTLFKKIYSPEEEELRKEIFIENRQAVIDFNSKFASGKSSFVQQVNEYADMLSHEFNAKFNGFNKSRSDKRVRLPTPTTFVPSANAKVPENFDWRKRGAVTSVKKQGDCMGCYAFASAGALESHNFRKTGQLVELSPQQILDCSKGYGNEGCKGGLMTDAFEYVKNQPGLNSLESNPYEGQDKECRFNPQTVKGYCTGYVEIPEGDEKALEYAVATVGPVTAAIDASVKTFQFYKDGVYYDMNCKNKQEDMNHGVLIVGYGVESDGKKYWLIKNSYGIEWGNGGYVKLAKDAGNHCGIANSASYPLV